MDAQIRQFTVEDFESFVQQPENADRLFEFIGGEIVEVVSYDKSTALGLEIGRLIGNWVAEHKPRPGHVTGADGGYIVGDQRYIPDVGYISKEKYPKLSGAVWIPQAPDLAVEVLSPSNTPNEIAIKTTNYLAAGTVVWVIEPEKQTIAVHQTAKSVKIYQGEQVLDGGDVLPGFSLKIGDLFDIE